MRISEDISFATATSLSDLLREGVPIEVRGQQTLELRNRIITLKYPEQRCLFLPGRGNDPFAAIAETLWMLAGHDDINWISEYLPRAPDFSDDGVTWRAAYGPRIRNWAGIDQLRDTARLLRSDRNSRRAVMSLFDPARDFVETLDVPCTNWLSWLIRNGQLHLVVGIRSNDVWWGFSGINAFEWSVLQQWMAHWVGTAVGDLTFVAPSFHLYQRHFEKARAAVARFRGITCYQHGLSAPRFVTSLDAFDDTLEQVFSIESGLRMEPAHNPYCLGDPFLDECMSALQLRHASQQGASIAELAALANRMIDCDLKAAAVAWLARKHRGLIGSLAEGPTKRFMSEYFDTITKAEGSAEQDFATAVARLHRRKDRAYGDAWKKRGEVRSILPNIARKIDRLSAYLKERTELADETLLDTTIDLLVYVVKYRLYLLDDDSVESSVFLTPASILAPYSDGSEAFEAVIDQVLEAGRTGKDIDELITVCTSTFEELDYRVFHSETRTKTLALVDELIRYAADLTIAVQANRPEDATLLIAQEQQRMML